jgi:hypothetical protein
MADNAVADEPRPIPDEPELMLPSGWVDAFLARLVTDGDEEPNVLRGLD